MVSCPVDTSSIMPFGLMTKLTSETKPNSFEKVMASRSAKFIELFGYVLQKMTFSVD
jgi:hypothetical protein